MDVTKIPFNQFIGLSFANKPGYLMMLDNNSNYLNHLSTIHASALFALAEASGGHFLIQEFSQIENIIPVVRKVETKFRKPATGTIYSSARLVDTTVEAVQNELCSRQRALITVRVSLFTTSEELVMQSDFEWFVTLNR